MSPPLISNSTFNFHLYLANSYFLLLMVFSDDWNYIIQNCWVLLKYCSALTVKARYLKPWQRSNFCFIVHSKLKKKIKNYIICSKKWQCEMRFGKKVGIAGECSYHGMGLSSTGLPHLDFFLAWYESFEIWLK